MMSNNAHDIPNPHWVLQCCYQDLFELMRIHFRPLSKGRPTPEIVSLQKRIEELESICEVDVTDYSNLYSKYLVNPLTSQEHISMRDLKRKMPEMFKKVNASEFFNTILEDRLNRNKSKVLMKNNQESVHNG